ncbi:unnamed protein product [Cuscuta europaea]|uniref:Uncharacterized protein n=1 Tax=Cuscuta europaea TaxID=41803 RepID=A0A9P0ZTF2_CUSEU|nr:unnamed protein product [Cuscuta europaea]
MDIFNCYKLLLGLHAHVIGRMWPMNYR